MKDKEVPLRLTVVNPPTDVVFALQRGRSQLYQPTRSSGTSLSFDFTVRVCSTGTSLTLLGPFAQGTPASRFVYVNSGTYAGDAASCWSRRAKVPLTGITPQLIRRLEQAPGSLLEGCIAGTAKDGGPACASVSLLGQGWCVNR
ncbi:MAG: DUF5990 family protein [Acidobacteriota bacterium]